MASQNKVVLKKKDSLIKLQNNIWMALGMEEFLNSFFHLWPQIVFLTPHRFFGIVFLYILFAKLTLYNDCFISPC